MTKAIELAYGYRRNKLVYNHGRYSSCNSFFVKLGIWNELKFYRIVNRVFKMKSGESLALLSSHYQKWELNSSWHRVIDNWSKSYQ